MHLPDTALPPSQVYARLEPGVQDLVTVVATLYDGQWDDCAEDLRRRRCGRPYLFRFDLPVAEPLAWIRRLQAYEMQRGETFASALLASAGPCSDPFLSAAAARRTSAIPGDQR
jgi:hypothetical protein